jgi:hypothetical protein
MEWLIRFWLGLPARPQDAHAVHSALPEITRDDWSPRGSYLLVALSNEILSSREFANHLKNWIRRVDEQPRIEMHSESCPSPNCPLRAGAEATSGDFDGSNEPFIARLMVAAGGPNAKPPKDAFLDLVRKVHPHADAPQEVILTDPYIYTDVSEDGLQGGFSALVSYLDALGLGKFDTFTLTTTPSPKRGTITARRNLQRLLRGKYKAIRFNDFSPQLAFHDRFYQGIAQVLSEAFSDLRSMAYRQIP